MKTRVKLIKEATTREQVYNFANGCIAHGEVEVAAAAVICFEWLQRPENIIAGHLKWSDYRSGQFPTAIRIVHHKTGQIVLHPLEEVLPSGQAIKFYADAEAVLAKLARRGPPMILREVDDGKSKPYSMNGVQKIVQRMRKELKLPTTFTLDACRHGGMTELEEAELTVRAAPSLLTKPSNPMRATPNETCQGLCLPLESATHIRWRTQRQHLFRMRQVTAFRMKISRIREAPELID